MQHHSFCVLSLIISFKFHPLISLLHLQSIYILWVEHRSAISRNSTVTSFIILPELFKPSFQWGNTESRATSSHSRALKSGFPFLSQSGNYPVLKSSILYLKVAISWIHVSLSSSRRRSEFCSTLDLVFDGCFSFVRNQQYFTMFCSLFWFHIMPVSVTWASFQRRSTGHSVCCHLRLNVDIQKEKSRRKTVIPTDWAKSW